MTELIVDVVAEEVQKEHVAADMEHAAVEECVGDELPEVGAAGGA